MEKNHRDNQKTEKLKRIFQTKDLEQEKGKEKQVLNTENFPFSNI